MRRSALAMAMFLACAAPGFSHAGIYGDDLSRCLVKAMSDSDQADLTLWIYSAMSLHPSARPYSTMTQAQGDAASRKVAKLVERLLTVDCRSQTVDALKYEGASALEPAFGLAGGAAMRGLMNDPQVAKGIARMADFFDAARLEEVGKEAGVSNLGATTKPNP